MAHVILHNLSTQEDFEYKISTREAQALVDLAWVTARKGAPVDWAIKDASHDVLIPKCLRMDGGQ
ncbi:hypothetical protein [Streptomyces sp. NPDC010273]|uniref:hypothetical protein n=1 Tax=Streptomyces sp. NPDC010273 TaxID=3364829 RepID=UPI0036E82198